MRRWLVQLVGPILLGIHLILNLFPQAKGLWSELYLYNFIPLCAIAIVVFAPRINDRFGHSFIAAAIILWLIGSLVSSFSTYYIIAIPTQLFANIAYLLFYPVIIIGLPKIISQNHTFSRLEIFDALIIALGLVTLGTTLALKRVLPHNGAGLGKNFFSITFPVADLILLSLIFTLVLVRGISRRGSMFILGAVIFSVSDYLFLGMNVNGTYSFGSLVDDGWLVGLLLISMSLWQRNSGFVENRNANPVLITLSVFLSATILALIALRPGYFPSYVLLPTITTLILAFIRMTIALKTAKNFGHEQILARTDELTGLPNRRTLISEIENFMGKDGSLMLLDLDGFKPVNDAHGHAAGDKVLQQVALRFGRALPDGALLARLGGDEFGVLFEGSYESAMDVALALRATVSYPFDVESQHIKIGVSIGVAANNGAPDLLRRADDAMYRAKREGLGVYRP